MYKKENTTKSDLFQRCKFSLTFSNKLCNSPHQQNERRKKYGYLNSGTKAF